MAGKLVDNATVLIPLPKSVASAAEPVLPVAGSMGIWEKNDETPVRSFLEYRQGANYRRVELTSYTPPAGIATGPVTCTTANITLYVATTGSDANDGLTVPTAMLTIQAAINKLPNIINHAVVINVGAGTFDGFSLDGRVFVSGKLNASLTITGAAFINYTPIGGGTGSGTSNSGTTRVLGDSTQAWATNSLRGKIVYVNSTYFIIRKNDATTLELVGFSTSLSGVAYQIMGWATTLNTLAAEGWGSTGVIAVVANSSNRNQFTITRFAITVPGGLAGIYVRASTVPTFSFISTNGGGYGINCQYCIASLVITDSVVTNNTSTSIMFFDVGHLAGSSRLLVYNALGAGYSILVYSVCDINTGLNWYADDNAVGKGGICFDGCTTGYMSDLYVTNHTATNAAGICFSKGSALRVTNITLTGNYHGIRLYGNINNYYNIVANILLTGTNVISNNLHDGIHLTGPATFRLEAVTGTGNAGWGVNAQNGAKVYMNAATTLTGTLGNATVNNLTPLVWATDFATDGDSAVNDVDSSLIIRRESMV